MFKAELWHRKKCPATNLKIKSKQTNMPITLIFGRKMKNIKVIAK